MAIDLSPPKVPKTQLFIITWCLFSSAAISFFLRILIRIRYSRRVFFDDGFSLFAILCLLANALLITFMAPSMYTTIRMEKLSSGLNLGRRQTLLDSISFYLKLQFSETIVYWTCLWAVKASFLAFFKPLTAKLRAHVIAWWVIVVVTVLAYAACVISYPISCSSFEALGCTKDRNLRLALVSLRVSTAMDIASDLLIMALPISLAIRVRLPLRTRIALCGVFSLGGFIIVFSVIRIIVTNTTHKRPELSWLNLWSSVEASVACIVCNLAPFKVWFRGKKKSTQGSDPYQYTPRQASHGKVGVDSYELSQRSAERAEYLERPYAGEVPSNPRLYSNRNMRTHVTADQSSQEHGRPVRDGVIMVSRKVDRKEMASDQVTVHTDASDDEGRTLWVHSTSSAEVILPPSTKGNKR